MRLTLEEVGPIRNAQVDFGDLTVLVGQQATGKSICLQLLRLVLDAGQIQQVLRKYGLDWSRSIDRFLDVYLGEGMSGIWKEGTSRIMKDGSSFELSRVAARKQTEKPQSLFYIPAQRVLAVRDGWPRPFTDYSAGDPFAVRDFSEALRVQMDQGLNGEENVFPQSRRLKSEFRDMVQEQFFPSFALRVDNHKAQKRLVLGNAETGNDLPFMVWSAGQREFVPLLLGLYWLLPRTRTPTRDEIKWVVLEEPEMGLHPRAISVVLLLVLELVHRGYKVCLSTHSPQVLDAVWALRQLRELRASSRELLRIFGAPQTQGMQFVADSALACDLRVCYFDRKTGSTTDISELEFPAEDGLADWGGLTEFSGRVNQVVADAVNSRESR